MSELKRRFMWIVSHLWGQSWYWTADWQTGEREVDADIAAGRVEEWPPMPSVIVCPTCCEEAMYGDCPGMCDNGWFTHDEDAPDKPFTEPIACEICDGDGDGYYCVVGDHFFTEKAIRALARP